MKQNKLRTQRKQNTITILGIQVVLILFAFTLYYIDSQLQLGVSSYIITSALSVLLIIYINQFIIWAIRNKLIKGIKYSYLHYITMLRIRQAFLDANYFNKRIYFNKEIANLPKIKVEFDNSFSKGKLFIENININKNIGEVNISFALNRFIVDRSYLSNDENYYIFEIYDSNINHQLHFNYLEDFVQKTNEFDDYTLFVDKSTSMTLYGALFVGQTGSGKTYALYSLILQMLNKNISYHIYFADPKNSSLAVLGEKISAENTADDIENIIELLETFNKEMNYRKTEIKEMLNTKLEATYADFNYEPHIFIFDEFASFQTTIQAMEKKKRDKVMKLLSQVVLQGRQLGFFLWIVMQKSDASLLPTSLRENLPVKFVLGNAENQTYITTFGVGADIPIKDFNLGQGVFTCPDIANTPKICHFSYLDFDILKAVTSL